MRNEQPETLGISGRIARTFLSSQLTPLLALAGLLLGLFAIAVTPKEEEPQIDVTMANVFVPFPGASAREVENLVSTPAEQVLGEIDGVEHVTSVSSPGMSLLTVQFKVGVPRQEALVKLYNQVLSNADWLPANLGTGTPLVKPKGIDDVPIMSLTLSSQDPGVAARDLADVAHTLETELKRVPGTRDIYTIGAPDDIVRVTLDPARLAAYNIDINALRASLVAANRAMGQAQVVQDGRQVELTAGDFFRGTADVASLVVGTRGGEPVYLSEVADIARTPDSIRRTVWTGFGPASGRAAEPLHPALTIAIAKQPGQNAIDITERIEAKLAALRNVAIPAGVEVTITRDYGQTAADKSAKLIHKLLFATAAVVALVFFALGRREAFIVGSAVIITLAVTLFAGWAWGFTLNRVSLFALIFSIGILVDDAIVVVENIHRHRALPENDGKSLFALIPRAVDEVGAPTILATLTVIAALMPMAFVSGLMGPYMSPIPINASTGMLISLAVAFVITPWMAAKWLGGHDHAAHAHAPSALDRRFAGLAQKLLAPLVTPEGGKGRRHRLYWSVLGAIAFAVALPVLGIVVMKMLPFDNKSEFQVVVDMPEGTPVEDTQRVLVALADNLRTVPEVDNVQLYAGTAAPINFNGLVRQYYLRRDANQGDIQVNLADKAHRHRSSHEIALSVRAALQANGKPFNANVKIVEVPPGPPVLAPIVAEVYGYDDAQRTATAQRVRAAIAGTPDVVDVDDTLVAPAPRVSYVIDRAKAARLGVEYAQVVQAIASLTGGDDVSHLHDGQAKFAVPIRLALGDADKADPAALLTVKLTAANGRQVALGDVVTAVRGTIEQPIYHKDLLPVVYVTADVAGNTDSPLYGMFKAADAIADGKGPAIAQTYTAQPWLATGPALKWDGEWQITYETFRDMGIAYGVGMLLIYLLVVAQFGSYTVPLVIMAPIPLTVIGVMPGHALFGAQFTATSMIGMIALAGIIVRNSILLVDFTNEQLRQGVALREAIVNASAVRAKPILLTAFAAIIGAFFIVDDPIFNGLAIALIFGIFVSSLLTLVVIPVLYYVAMRGKYGA